MGVAGDLRQSSENVLTLIVRQARNDRADGRIPSHERVVHVGHDSAVYEVVDLVLDLSLPLDRDGIELLFRVARRVRGGRVLRLRRGWFSGAGTAAVKWQGYRCCSRDDHQKSPCLDCV